MLHSISLVPCLFVLLLSVLVSLPAVVPPVSAHNWLGNLGRSQMASTRYPWPLKVTASPHIQVGTNQTFVVDWSAGHGNILTLFNQLVFTTFIILHADDQDKVPLTPSQLNAAIKRYIDEAPAAAWKAQSEPTLPNQKPAFVNLTAAGPMWDKLHLLPPPLTTQRLPNPAFQEFNDTIPMYFNEMINRTHPRWIPRDTAMLASCKSAASGGGICSNSNPPSAFIYQDNQLNLDIRLEYYNPNLPWIESLHRFQISVTQTTFTNTYSTARFRIPGRKGPGNYMLWFIWRGYYDVVDVNLRPEKTVQYPYGAPASGSSTVDFVRVDHAEFTYFDNPIGSCRLVPRALMNVTRCLADCAASSNCQQVQVSRVSNLPFSLPGVSPIPTLWFNSSQYDFMSRPPYLGPCGYRNQAERLKAGCKVQSPRCDLAAIGAKNDDYICWSSAYIFVSAAQATPGWFQVSEPEDPQFFSTIYFKTASGRFLSHPPYKSPSTSWIAGDYCVNCQYLNYTRSLPKDIAPNWENQIVFASEGRCEACDRPQ